MRRLAGAVLALALGSCASLSERECRGGDWSAIGREDGSRGLPVEELERHRDACAEHGVRPDEPAWRAGHADGIAAYCTPAGGYVAGRRGDGYRDVCRDASEEAFLHAYQRGRDVHRRLVDVRELRQRIADHEMAAFSGEYSPEDRTRLRFRAEELERRLWSAERELEQRDRRYAREFGAPELSRSEMR